MFSTLSGELRKALERIRKLEDLLHRAHSQFENIIGDSQRHGAPRRCIY